MWEHSNTRTLGTQKQEWELGLDKSFILTNMESVAYKKKCKGDMADSLFTEKQCGEKLVSFFL